MERKIRNRMTKDNAQMMLIKYLPWLFIIFLLLASYSLGVTGAAGEAGVLKPVVD